MCSRMLSKLLYTLLYSSISLLVAAFSPFAPERSHQCYFIDGSFDPAGGPCYGNVGASMCCYSGENCHPISALCLTSPNGPVGQYDNGSSIWRRSCTDFTWQDAACLAIAYDVGTKSVQLSNCSDGTVCPRTKEDENTTCCEDNHQGQFAALGHARIPESAVSSIRATGTSTASSAPPTNSSISSIAPATASQIAASTSVPAPTSASLSASTAGLDQSAKIGIGVGISFGTLLVALLSFIAFRLYRNSQSNSPNLGKAEESASESKELEETAISTGIQQRHEMTSFETPKEMYTSHNIHEVGVESGA